jgi:hypothetical protein
MENFSSFEKHLTSNANGLAGLFIRSDAFSHDESRINIPAHNA